MKFDGFSKIKDGEKLIDVNGVMLDVGTEYIDIDGDIYAYDDFFETFTVCDVCDEIIEDAYSVLIRDTGEYVCEDCADTYFHKCEDCGDYYEELYTYSGILICRDCFNSGDYTYCADCGDCICIDDRVVEHNGGYYCQECGAKHNYYAPHIHEYDYKPDWVEHRLDEPDPDNLLLGFELEVDDADDIVELSQAIYNNFDEDLLFQKHDGSLSDDGVELVSHPCTINYYNERFDFDKLIGICQNYGARSHDTSTCGFHIHTTRSGWGTDELHQELNISKLLLFFNKFWEELVIFSRRNYAELNQWAALNTTELVKNDKYYQQLKKCKNHIKSSCDRYQAINLQNWKTLEFRLFRGTLSKDTLLATLDFVWALRLFVETYSVYQINHMQWTDFVDFLKSRNLLNVVKYLEKRNILK